MLSRTITTSRRAAAQFSRNALRSLSSEAREPTPISTFSPEKMEADKRYAASQQAPESLSKPYQSDYSIVGKARLGRAAYLDMQATTPMDPRVLDVMLPYMIGSFGNPHSRTHQFGWESEQVVEHAGEQVANLISD